MLAQELATSTDKNKIIAGLGFRHKQQVFSFVPRPLTTVPAPGE
jgi:hypothetical protein